MPGIKAVFRSTSKNKHGGFVVPWLDFSIPQQCPCNNLCYFWAFACNKCSHVMILCASLAFMLCYGCIPVCISCTYQENYYIMGVHVERKIIDGVHRIDLLVQDLGC